MLPSRRRAQGGPSECRYENYSRQNVLDRMAALCQPVQAIMSGLPRVIEQQLDIYGLLRVFCSVGI